MPLMARPASTSSSGQGRRRQDGRPPTSPTRPAGPAPRRGAALHATQPAHGLGDLLDDGRQGRLGRQRIAQERDVHAVRQGPCRHAGERLLGVALPVAAMDEGEQRRLGRAAAEQVELVARARAHRRDRGSRRARLEAVRCARSSRRGAGRDRPRRWYCRKPCRARPASCRATRSRSLCRPLGCSHHPLAAPNHRGSSSCPLWAKRRIAFPLG